MISGKIVSLKDRESGSIFPQTSSEAVYMNDGKTLEELTDEGIYFSDTLDTIQVNKPEIVEKVDNMENRLNIIEDSVVDIVLNDVTADILNNLITNLEGRPANIQIKNGTYIIDKSVFIPYNISINGNKSIFLFDEKGLYTNKYMFLINSSDAETWNDRFTAYRAIFENFTIKNTTSDSTFRGIFCVSQNIFKNLEFDNLYCSIQFGIDGRTYVDTVELDTIRILNHRNESGAAIIKKCYGDGWLFKKITLNTNYRVYNLLSLEQTYGFTIDTIVNGSLSFTDCRGYVCNVHNERGNIVITNSNITLNNIYLTNIKQQDTNIPLRILGGTQPNQNVSLNNVYFIYETYDETENSNIKQDIDINIIANLSINNVYRCVSDNRIFLHKSINNTSKTNYQSPIIAKQNSSGNYILWSEFNFKPYYAYNCDIKNGNIITKYYAKKGNCDNNNLLVQDGSSGWNSDFSTYYYKLLYVLDDTRKIMSAETTEQTITVNKIVENRDNNIFQSGVLITPIFDGMCNNLVVYRGISEQSYNKYCILPLCTYKCSPLHDNGNRIGTFPWIDRIPSNINTSEYNSQFTRIEQNDGNNIIAYGTSIPNYGTWSRGDRIYNTAYTIGSPRSWYCYSSGTPGKWKEEDVLI